MPGTVWTIVVVEARPETVRVAILVTSETMAPFEVLTPRLVKRLGCMVRTTSLSWVISVRPLAISRVFLCVSGRSLD